MSDQQPPTEPPQPPMGAPEQPTSPYAPAPSEGAAQQPGAWVPPGQAGPQPSVTADQTAPTVPYGALPLAPGTAPAYGAPPVGQQAYGAPPVGQQAYGAPPVAQPGQYPGLPPQYPGQPLYPAPPGYGVSPGPDTRPKTLAIIAFVLAVVGAVVAFVPVATLFSGVLLLAGFIIGLIALISKKHGGTGLSIAAIVVSVVGWIVSIVMTVVSIGMFGWSTFGGDGSVSQGTETSAPADGLRDGAPVADAKALAITATGFGQASDGTWWYAFELENPNTDAVYDATQLTVEAVGADGTILDSSPEYVTVLPGKSGVAGYFENLGDENVAKIEVRTPPTSDATALPADAGGFQVADVAATADGDGPVVRGTVVSSFGQDQESVLVSAIVRDADGNIVGGEYDVIDRVPAGGRTRFAVRFYDDLPPGATVEVYPSL
ncbi:hypothetical protein [Microbacterium candidum]|uniref:DUF4190 domain-containing protein n=1 Tax=Microbacterium candidum TaxID=3041922 RepID=A0ABT7MWR4_9MICO|nr:hypothetical protein [Microbacterium sp. ASV49]MDL9978895.1 hypothetical protein [Microbacterium sp. ASV49]